VPANYKEVPFVETAPQPDLTRRERLRGYLLFQRPITEPIHPNTYPRESERLHMLTGFATPGEYEPLTFGVYPIRDLKNFRVQVSELVGPAARIARSEISLRLVTYWNIGYPRYTSRDTYRRLPELLEQVDVHSSPAGECQRWWLRVHVPPETPPGVYRGTVTIWDDDFQQASAIPVTLRVLGFPLQRDPAKHYSVYYNVRNSVQFRDKSEAFVRAAMDNEHRAMIAYGIDMVPTLSLTISADGRRAELRYPEELQRMLDLGMTGPVPVTGGNMIGRIYRATTPGGTVGSHWLISKLPPPEFYQRVTDAFRALANHCKAKGWPDLVCCPLDEVTASRKDFGARVYKAVKSAGIRTYATKNPRAPDAAPYMPYIDVWCSQPYSVPYQRIVAQQRYEYWSYPNHNAGEIKDRRVMCKGGRMTYGFGFWRSGYTTLIPWHWAWTPAPDQFDYLRGSRSGCGQRIDEQGNVIPAIYWECFREGRDDARYLYTLQQAAWERVGATSAECREAVRDARRLLQSTWYDIHVQQKYLATGMWPSSEFQARRWRMAAAITKLQSFPSVRSGQAPSVLVDRTEPPRAVAEPTLVERAEARGIVASTDLLDDISQWKNATQEGHVEIVTRAGTDGQKALRWRVDIDHQKDGGEGGKYPIGWPRLARSFPPNSLNLADFDYLAFNVRVDSNRDEVADDTTPLRILITSHQKGRQFYESVQDLGDRQRVWIPIRLAIKDMIQATGLGTAPWKSISRVQLYLAERDFRDGTSVTFDIADLRLLRFTAPQIAAVRAPSLVLLPRAMLAVGFDIMGNRSVAPGTHQITAELRDGEDHVHAREKADLYGTSRVVLKMAGVVPGSYQLRVRTTAANGGPNSVLCQPIQCIAGPLWETPTP